MYIYQFPSFLRCSGVGIVTSRTTLVRMMIIALVPVTSGSGYGAVTISDPILGSFAGS